MKLEATSDMPPRAVIAAGLATLASPRWVLRSLTENHLHLAGRAERDTRGVKAFLLTVLAVFVFLVVMLVAEVDFRIGSMPPEGVLAIYSLVAWPTALVYLIIHFLDRRGEAGIVVAALPHEAGSTVIAQAYGSAFAQDEVEAFVERVQSARDIAQSVRLADRVGP